MFPNCGGILPEHTRGIFLRRNWDGCIEMVVGVPTPKHGEAPATAVVSTERKPLLG